MTIHDLKKTGAVLSAALDAGANNVNGPQFEFENPQALRRQALVKAMEDAKAKAALLAQNAGASLGEVLTITESGAPAVWPRLTAWCSMRPSLTPRSRASWPV